MIIQDEDKNVRSSFRIVYNISISFLFCYSCNFVPCIFLNAGFLTVYTILGGLFDTTEEADRDTKQETAFR